MRVGNDQRRGIDLIDNVAGSPTAGRCECTIDQNAGEHGCGHAGRTGLDHQIAAGKLTVLDAGNEISNPGFGHARSPRLKRAAGKDRRQKLATLRQLAIFDGAFLSQK